MILQNLGASNPGMPKGGSSEIFISSRRKIREGSYDCSEKIELWSTHQENSHVSRPHKIERFKWQKVKLGDLISQEGRLMQLAQILKFNFCLFVVAMLWTPKWKVCPHN
jgi:hypothetical protein